MEDTRQPRGASWVGRVLDGRYHVESVIGRGGMGSTLLATDCRQFGRRVAIKIPHGEVLATQDFRDRFILEIKQLIAREHPHIVKLYDSGESDGIPYAVMQYLPGGSLRERLEGGKTLTIAQVTPWLGAIADALDFIHGKMLHRDVKPENILFDAEGHAYLVDFGIAKVFSDPMLVTRRGTLLGSPPYMAPEAATGKRLAPTYDQYALGVVAFEALSGQWPFQQRSDEDEVTFLIRKSGQQPPPLRSLNGSVPVHAADAVMKALSNDPRRRYNSCREFATAVGEGTGVSHRWRPVAAASAAAIVVLSAWTFFSGASGREQPPATTPTSPAITPPARGEPQWIGFQERMNRTHATMLEEDRAPGTEPAGQIERWRRFLADFSADNPSSSEDETLRASARETLQRLERGIAPSRAAPQPAPAIAVPTPVSPSVQAVQTPPPIDSPPPAPPQAPEPKAPVERESRPPAEPEPRRQNIEAIRDSLARAGQMFDRSDYDGAVKAYEAVLVLDPDSVPAREGLDRARRAQEAESRLLRRLQGRD
jgi:serine/threonine protein kinase